MSSEHFRARVRENQRLARIQREAELRAAAEKERQARELMAELKRAEERWRAEEKRRLEEEERRRKEEERRAALRGANVAHDMAQTADATRRAMGEGHSVAIDAIKLPEHPGSKASREQLEQFIADLNQAILLLDAEVRRIAQIAGIRDKVDGWKPSQPKAAVDGGEGPKASLTKAEAEDLKEQVKQRLARTPGDASPEDLKNIDDALQAALSQTDATLTPHALRELDVRINNSRKTSRARARVREEVETLRRSLHGLEGADISALSAEMDEIIAGIREPLPTLPDRARAAVDRAKKAADDQYILDTIRESLIELDYDVKEEFRTFHTGGTTYAELSSANPDSENYELQIEVTKDKLVDFQLVRRGRQPLPGDNEAEERLCKKLDQLHEKLQAKGVEVAELHRIPVGRRELEKQLPTSAETKAQSEKPTNQQIAQPAKPAQRKLT